MKRNEGKKENGKNEKVKKKKNIQKHPEMNKIEYHIMDDR